MKKKCKNCQEFQDGGIVDEKKQKAQKVVDVARKRIKENKYVDVPESLQKIAEGRNESANSCIGGVCTVLQESGVMKDVNWSNTDFALKAKDYGFPNKGYGVKGLKNLEPGDVLQHINNPNEQGNYYPGHAQIFLGKNDNGEYEFFDNYRGARGEGGTKTYNEEELNLWLNPKRTKTERSASIYKVNPYTAPEGIPLSPEAQADVNIRASVRNYDKKTPSNYKYSIRQDAKDYNVDTKPIMDKFVEFANDDFNIDSIAKKTGKSKEEVHDSLLNVFGELGQENKWQNRTFAGAAMGLEGVFEKMFKPKNKSIGPGQIKFNSIPQDLKDNFGIKKPKDLYDLNKIMPLMAAMDLKDKQVLTNWGNNNSLSDKLINKTDEINPLIANDLKGGVGRWSPYLRNQYSTISKGKQDANFRLDEGSYPDKVFHNIDNNLERINYQQEGENYEKMLPEATVKSKKKLKNGGTISELGYKDNSPYKNRKKLTINTPSGLITTENMAFPILANGIPLYPNTGVHQFNTDTVTEIPMKAKKGSKVKAQNGLKYSPELITSTNFRQSAAQINPNNLGGEYYGAKDSLAYQPMNKQFDWGNAVQVTGALYNEFMPDQANRKYLRPEQLQSYNPNAYGTGSQAIMQDGGFVEPKLDKRVKRKLKGEVPNNYGKYNGVIGEDGKPIDVPTELQAVQTMINYMKNNNPDSNIYRPDFQHHSINAQPIPQPNDNPAYAKNGARVSNYRQGGLQTHEGGSAPITSYNPIDGGMGEFAGNSHKDGGIESTYNGKPFEAEGGEPYRIDSEGSLEIFGNLYNPLTGNKFKKDAKLISKQEKKAQKYLDKGVNLVNNVEPVSKYDKLAFNSGRAMLEGGLSKQKQLVQEKNKLSTIQQMLLQENPNVMNNGGIMTYQNGGVLNTFQGKDINDPRLKFATTLNKTKAELQRLYPGKKIEVKFNGLGEDRSLTQQKSIVASQKKAGKKLSGEFSAHNFDAARDYNIYIDGKPAPKSVYQNTLHKIGKEEGLFPLKGSASNDYFHMGLVEEGKGNTAKDILKKYPSIAKTPSTQKYFRELLTGDWMQDTMTKASKKALDAMSEAGTNTYVDENFVPKTIPQEAVIQGENLFTNPITPWTPENRLTKQPPVEPKTYNPAVPPTFNFTNPVTKPYQAPKRNRPWEQLAPAIPQLFDQADPVLMQKYTPDLFSPYSVSFQDRRNQNEAQLSGIRKMIQDPSALGTLGAQAYEANNAINAEEFRTNQGIYNDVTNKNVALLNDAKLKNLSLTDQQYQRQTQAIGNTRDRRIGAGIQIGDILAKNNLENKTLDVTSQLYKDYTYDENMQLQYVGDSNGANRIDATVDPLIPMRSSVSTKTGNTTSTQISGRPDYEVSPINLAKDLYKKSRRENGGKLTLSKISKLMHN